MKFQNIPVLRSILSVLGLMVVSTITNATANKVNPPLLPTYHNVIMKNSPGLSANEINENTHGHHYKGIKLVKQGTSVYRAQ